MVITLELWPAPIQDRAVRQTGDLSIHRPSISARSTYRRLSGGVRNRPVLWGGVNGPTEAEPRGPPRRGPRRRGNQPKGETGMSGFAEQTIATIAVRSSADNFGHAARTSCNCGSVEDSKCQSVP